MFKVISLLLLTGSLCARAGTHGGGVFVTSLQDSMPSKISNKIYSCYISPLSSENEPSPDFQLRLNLRNFAQIEFGEGTGSKIMYYQYIDSSGSYQSQSYQTTNGRYFKYSIVIKLEGGIEPISDIYGRIIRVYVHVSSSSIESPTIQYLCEEHSTILGESI